MLELHEMETAALALAYQAHLGQVDRSNEPMILHPIRVMMRLTDVIERTVALLHDVVEDTEWTVKDLRANGFTNEVADAVDAISRRPEETYSEYIHRVKQNRVATAVKLADLADNMSETRAARLPKELLVSGWRERKLRRYAQAVATLEGV